MSALEPKLNDENRRAILSSARQMAEQISEAYQLTLTLPERLSKPQRWRLEVVNSKTKRDERKQPVCPSRLGACK